MSDENKETKEIKETKVKKETKEKKVVDKEKESRTNSIIGIVFAVIVLVGAFFAAKHFNLFAGVLSIFSQIRVGWNILLQIITMAAIVYCIYFLIKIILRITAKKGGRAATMGSVLTSVFKYLAVLLGFCWGLSIIGVNVSTIFAGVGVLALIIGFGAESLVADLVTGTFMLFEDQFDVGDIVEVNGARGVVTDIGIRTTCIQDVGGNVMIVKNSDIKNLINRSNHDSVAVSIISVSYEENLEALEKRIPFIIDDIWAQAQAEVEAGGESVYEGKPEYLGVEELSSSSVDLKFRVRVSEKDIFQGRRKLNRDLKVAFDREGVAIPFPQLDIHQK